MNKNDKDSKEIAQWRKTTYYGGMIITGIGLIMFLEATFCDNCGERL